MILKKTYLILFFFTLSLYSCDPRSAIDPKHRGTFTLKNSSDQDIEIKGAGLIPLQVAKDSSANLYFGDMYVRFDDKYDKYFFYRIFDDNEKDSIIILSTKGDTLKVWREVEKDYSGRQYYHLDFWEETQEDKDHHIYINWLFELLPEDIVLN